MFVGGGGGGAARDRDKSDVFGYARCKSNAVSVQMEWRSVVQ